MNKLFRNVTGASIVGWKYIFAVLILLLSVLIGPVSPAMAASDKKVGIWFSTWYTNKGHYNWLDGNGAGSQKQFLSDVNGDGKADAVYFFDSGSLLGNWYVALSNGTSFGAPTLWLSGNGSGSQRQMLGDVNGDGKADAVFYFDTGSLRGNWYVALSNGTGFGTPSLWISGYGSGSQNQLLGDVNGDGKADAVAYFDVSGFAGKWYVATSNGSGFNGASMWIDGYGSGSATQLMGDTDGDGKADAIAYFQNGSSTIPPGAWYRATANSSGNGFNSSSLWKYGHGNYVLTTPSTTRLLGDVTGDGKSDPTAFVNSRGLWRVLPADHYTEPPELNMWEAWDINYKPVVNGTTGIYDSGDTAVIDAQINEIEAAGIDFMLLEETNGVEQNYIYPRAKAVCQRIAAHNAAGGHMKFAVAAGAVQGTHNPQTVEDEAALVKVDFVDDSVCGSSYYNYNGKPLYVAYGNYSDLYGSSGWIKYTSKTSTNDFTVIPALSKFAQDVTNYPSKTGSGCGTVPGSLTNTPSSSLYGTFLGWGMPYGNVGTGPYATVMPGWINKVGDRILRKQAGVDGAFYTTCGWDRVIANQPDLTLINSYNEFAERTAVEPADTTGIGDSNEIWPSNSYYWSLTSSKVSQLKS